MKSLTPAKMMVMLVIAFVGLVGAFVAKRLMAVETVVKKPALRNIPLALGDLPPGTVIKREHIGTGPWLSKEVVGDILLSPSGIIGRTVKVTIKGAAPIHSTNLYAFGELPPLKVSDKYQAVTIRLTNNSAILEGLIKPGDFADIHFTLTTMLDDPRVKKLGGVSMTLFRGVRILAINRDFVQSALQTSQNSVTVEVPAETANLLLVAAGKGDINLTYTKNDEGISTVAVSDADRATLEELLNLPPIPEPPAPIPPPKPPAIDPAQTTMIYRRSGRSQNWFRDNQPVQSAYPNGYNYNDPNGGYGNGGYGPGSNLNNGNYAPGMPSTSTNPGQFGPGQYGPGQYGPGQYGPGSFGPGQNPGVPAGPWNPNQQPAYFPQVSVKAPGRTSNVQSVMIHR